MNDTENINVPNLARYLSDIDKILALFLTSAITKDEYLHMYDLLMLANPELVEIIRQ